MSFLNYDSPFMVELRRVVDSMALGLLWIVASIPLVTFGAATTAMFYTREKAIRKDEGKIWSTFWKCFKKEFKQATLLWVIGLVLSVLLTVNGIVLWRMELHGIVFALLLTTVLFGAGWMQLWYGYLSKFEDTTWVLLGNTFRITLVNFPWVLLLVFLSAAASVGAVIAFFYMPPILLLVPGIYGILAGMVLRRIFSRYLPEEAREALPGNQESNTL